MVYFSDMPEFQRNMIANQGLPKHDVPTCAGGRLLSNRKISNRRGENE